MEPNNELPLERHPWKPFIPDGAKILIMGTFPPKPNRWCMDFYYPNRINDFWRIMGLIFYSNKDYFWDAQARTFKISDIKQFLTEKGIALNDTGAEVRRLKDNASDKFLDIVTPVNLQALLKRMPLCRDVATTGEKASQVIAELTDTDAPKMGTSVNSATGLRIWRMPSTSRAYPLAIDKKAQYYAEMFRAVGIL